MRPYESPAHVSGDALPIEAFTNEHKTVNNINDLIEQNQPKELYQECGGGVVIFHSSAPRAGRQGICRAER
jgi:hypothetical protein